jgi:hypothetical protein
MTDPTNSTDSTDHLVVTSMTDRAADRALRPTDRTWTVQDVSAYLAVPVSTLYEWRRTKYGPPARRVGKYLRYRPADVVDWFDGLDPAA